MLFMTLMEFIYEPKNGLDLVSIDAGLVFLLFPE